MDTYIGIDPGSKGAIAICSGGEINTYTLTGNYIEDAQLLRTLIDHKSIGITTVTIEDVPPTCGNNNVPAARAFSLGRSMGTLYGVAIGHPDVGIVNLTTPQQWQRMYKSPYRISTHKKEHKNHLKNCAKRLYPGLKITLDNCDALLIMHRSLPTTEAFEDSEAGWKNILFES